MSADRFAAVRRCIEGFEQQWPDLGLTGAVADARAEIKQAEDDAAVAAMDRNDLRQLREREAKWCQFLAKAQQFIRSASFSYAPPMWFVQSVA